MFSRSNHFLDIRSAHFVTTNERRRTMRPVTMAFRLKTDILLRPRHRRRTWTIALGANAKAFRFNRRLLLYIDDRSKYSASFRWFYRTSASWSPPDKANKRRGDEHSRNEEAGSFKGDRLKSLSLRNDFTRPCHYLVTLPSYHTRERVTLLNLLVGVSIFRLLTSHGYRISKWLLYVASTAKGH